MNPKFLFGVMMVTSTLALSAESAEPYKLRPEGAGAIAKKASPLPIADRLEIYITGPRPVVDNATSVEKLKNRQPDLALSDRTRGQSYTLVLLKL